MIGSNTLLLNKATVMAALQHYFDTVVYAKGQSPQVDSISLNGNTGDYQSRDMFSVGIKAPVAESSK